MMRFVRNLMRGRDLPVPRSDRSRRALGLDHLEARGLMTTLASTPDIVMRSVATPDPRQVVAQYDIQGAAVPKSFDVVVYRSADAQVDAADQEIARVHVTAPASEWGKPTLDAGGQIATAQGSHTLNIPIADGLAINPNRPYVLVAADPGGTVAQSDRTNDVAGLRKYSIVITSHGGLQKTPGDRIPAWQNRLNEALKAQGYDAVLGYNWVSVSNEPGNTVPMGRRLAAQVREAVAQAPAGAPVDLHFIGHSQGAVVNTVAIQSLEKDPVAAVDQGFTRHTMLDPHAANNGFPRPQYSVKDSWMGTIAQQAINLFQARAKDPFASVPASVDASDVYFQHTYFAQAKGTSRDSAYFNLWGQVPVKGPGLASYYDLTGPGISHSGDYSVVDWYKDNVVSGLGDGRQYAYPNLVTAKIDPANGQTGLKPQSRNAMARRSEVALGTDSSDPTSNSPTARNQSQHLTIATSVRPRFLGTAPPGSKIKIIGTVGDGSRLRLGETMADATGQWTIATNPLRGGRYKVMAIGVVPASPNRPHLHSTPRLPLGTLVIDPTGIRTAYQAAVAAG